MHTTGSPAATPAPAAFTPTRATVPPATFGYREIAGLVLGHFDAREAVGQCLAVLEAGGGSASHLPLPADARITTIDISPEQLARNNYAAEKLLGDLETFDYGMRRFDLIIAWDVLEHLQKPEAALARFAEILKPGGRILIVGPLPNTLKGLVTKYTPHGVHVFFYRHILGSTTAGFPGHAPFHTEHAAAACPLAMAGILGARGLQLEAVSLFESVHIEALRRRGMAVIALYRVAEAVLWAATLGRSTRAATDFVLIARKPA